MGTPALALLRARPYSSLVPYSMTLQQAWSSIELNVQGHEMENGCPTVDPWLLSCGGERHGFTTDPWLLEDWWMVAP
jgi:hypothetical protein